MLNTDFTVNQENIEATDIENILSDEIQMPVTTSEIYAVA